MQNRIERQLVTICMLIGTLMVLFTGIAGAATITVKQAGGGDYTTIGAAVNAAQPGDTIMVYPGTYNEAVVLNKNLTLQGSGPQDTVISSPGYGIAIGMSGVTATISGFKISSTNSGIYTIGGTTTEIKNNIISSGQYGIYISPSTTRSTITNNTISYNSLGGINKPKKEGTQPLINIMNNIISNNSGYGIELTWATASISYNDLYLNTAGNYLLTDSPVSGTSDKAVDPLFLDGPTGNFILQKTTPSPCLNAGHPASEYNDPDGTLNDMGAYGGPGAAAFWPYPPGSPIITGLTVTPASVKKGGTITIRATATAN